MVGGQGAGLSVALSLSGGGRGHRGHRGLGARMPGARMPGAGGESAGMAGVHGGEDRDHQG